MIPVRTPTECASKRLAEVFARRQQVAALARDIDYLFEIGFVEFNTCHSVSELSMSVYKSMNCMWSVQFKRQGRCFPNALVVSQRFFSQAEH